MAGVSYPAQRRSFSGPFGETRSRPGVTVAGGPESCTEAVQDTVVNNVALLRRRCDVLALFLCRDAETAFMSLVGKAKVAADGGKFQRWDGGVGQELFNWSAALMGSPGGAWRRWQCPGGWDGGGGGSGGGRPRGPLHRGCRAHRFLGCGEEGEGIMVRDACEETSGVRKNGDLWSSARPSRGLRSSTLSERTFLPSISGLSTPMSSSFCLLSP